MHPNLEAIEYMYYDPFDLNFVSFNVLKELRNFTYHIYGQFLIACLILWCVELLKM